MDGGRPFYHKVGSLQEGTTEQVYHKWLHVPSRTGGRGGERENEKGDVPYGCRPDR